MTPGRERTIDRADFTHRHHPEKCIDGFTSIDGTVKFFSLVKAILLKSQAKNVLDFGAGRGAFAFDDPSQFRRHLRDLRTFGAHVTACDVDEAVLGHGCSDEQVVVAPVGRLPFADSSFDVIVSDMTFEHIENAPLIARELLRALRPGGYICARTPNKFGYVRILAGLVPNRLHARLLRRVQPERAAQDVFPTVYRMNSVSQIRDLFPGCGVYHFHDNAEPSYYFGNRFLYRLILLAHTFLPQRFATTVCFFIEKPCSAKVGATQTSEPDRDAALP